VVVDMVGVRFRERGDADHEFIGPRRAFLEPEAPDVARTAECPAHGSRPGTR